MLRIIVRTTDACTAAHLGGPGTPIDVSFKTFDVDAPEVQTFLAEWRRSGSHIDRCVVGVEILDDDERK